MLNPEERSALSVNLPFWEKLTESEKEQTAANAYRAHYQKGAVLLSPGKECLGLLLVESGQLRAYITSGEGKQITLFRLLPLDVCMLTASCQIKNMSFDVTIETEKETTVFVIPVAFFHELSEKNSAVKNFQLEMMAALFSEVLWVLDQYVFGSAAERLANFLLEHSALQESDTLKLTHEFIANDLGTAREVVTRLLKHFSLSGLISLSRGSVTITDRAGLQAVCR